MYLNRKHTRNARQKHKQNTESAFITKHVRNATKIKTDINTESVFITKQTRKTRKTN